MKAFKRSLIIILSPFAASRVVRCCRKVYSSCFNHMSTSIYPLLYTNHFTSIYFKNVRTRSSSSTKECSLFVYENDVWYLCKTNLSIYRPFTAFAISLDILSSKGR